MRKKRLRKAIKWFKTQKNLGHVTIHLRQLKGDAEYGYVDHVGPYDFDLWINPNIHKSVLSLFSTLFHELTHVDQFSKGRLASTEKGWFWNGDLCKLAYEEQPWEIEATAVEEPLARLYLETR